MDCFGLRLRTLYTRNPGKISSVTRHTFGTIRMLPSGRWQAVYVGPEGQRHKAHTTFMRKPMAEKWLADEYELVEHGAWTAPQRRDPLTATQQLIPLADWCETVIRQRETRAQRPLRTLRRPDVAMLYQVADDETDRTLAARISGLVAPTGRWHVTGILHGELVTVDVHVSGVIDAITRAGLTDAEQVGRAHASHPGAPA